MPVLLAGASVLTRGTFHRSAATTVQVRRLGALTAAASTLVVFPRSSVAAAATVTRGTFRATAGATVLVVVGGSIPEGGETTSYLPPEGEATIWRLGLSAATLTRGTFRASAPASAYIRKRGTVSAGVTVRVRDVPRVGFARAPYELDNGQTSFNVLINAAWNREIVNPDGTTTVRPGWTSLGPGQSHRYEFGPNGNFFIYSTLGAPKTAEGQPVNFPSAVDSGVDPTFWLQGTFVRRDGFTSSMSATLEHRSSYDNVLKGFLGWLTSTPTGSYYGLTASFDHNLRFRTSSGDRRIEFDVGLGGTGGASGYFDSSGLTVSGNLTVSGLGAFGSLRAGNHPVHGATWPGIWNAANVLSGNYALLASTTTTILNAPTGGAVSLRNNNTEIAQVNANGLQVTSGQLYGPGSASAYGALSINGVKNTYSGINFRSGASNLGTFMVHNTGAIQGWYNSADSNWHWYWQNGVLTTGTVPVANISGLANSATITASTAIVPSTLVQRDAANSIYVGQVNGDGVQFDFPNTFIDDLLTYRASNGNTSSLYLNAAKDRHLQYNGSSYTLVGADCVINGVNNASSADYKQNIRDLGAGSREIVRGLRLRRYQYTPEVNDSQRERVGVIYEELADLLPEALVETELLDGGTIKAVDYSIIYGHAIRALQQEIVRSDLLQARVVTLEARLEALLARLDPAP